MDRSLARHDWAGELKAFTTRNAGRRTVLEVDGTDIGAQAEETDLPLRGVAYDPRDGRVEIMLGEQGSLDRHLTRSIAGPASIDVLSDENGRDAALRIGYGDGQTVLRFLAV